MRRLSAVAVGLMGLALVNPSSASAATEAIELSWDGTTYSTSVVSPFFAATNVIPGDSAGRSISVKNAGPSNAVLKAYIVDVSLLPDADHLFFKDVNGVWQGDLGTGKSTFSALSAVPGGVTQIGEKELEIDEVADVYVGFEYPRDDNVYNGNRGAGFQSGAFNVLFELTGDYSTSGLDVQIVPHLEDRDGDGFADVGERIRWQFNVKNTGNSSLRNVGLSSTYLSGLGISIDCPDVPLLAGGEMKCWADSMVSQEDLRRGAVSITVQTNGQNPDNSVVASDPKSLSIVVDSRPAPPVPAEPVTPTPTPTWTVLPTTPVVPTGPDYTPPVFTPDPENTDPGDGNPGDDGSEPGSGNPGGDPGNGSGSGTGLAPGSGPGGNYNTNDPTRPNYSVPGEQVSEGPKQVSYSEDSRTTCKELGRQNIGKADSEYRVYLDNDRDGIACEDGEGAGPKIGNINTGELTGGNTYLIAGGAGVLVLAGGLTFALARSRRNQD